MMLEKGKITGNQLTVIVVLMILPTAILFLPAISSAAAKQDAWISAVLAMLGGIGIALLVLALSLRFPDQPLDLFSEKIAGKIVGRCISFLYFWFFLHINSIIVREYVEYLSSAILPQTPLEVLIVTSLLVSGFAVRSGLEVIGRLGEFILPIVVMMILFILLPSTKDFEWGRLTPMMAEGFKPVIEGAFAPVSWFGEVVTVAFLIPFLNQVQASKKAVVGGIVLIGILLVGVAVITVGVFGASEVARMKFPTFELARVINIGNFLERVEWLVDSLWMLGAFMKITIYYYIAALVGARWFRLKDYKPLVFPIGLLLMVLSLLLYPNAVDLVAFLGEVWPPYSLIVFEVGIPLFLWTIALIRGQGRKAL